MLSFELGRRRGGRRGDQLLFSWREESGNWRGHLSHHSYRHDCSRIEFLRALGRGKGRVQNLNSNPAVCHTNILIPESQVALVETSIKNTTKNTIRVGIRILYLNLGFMVVVPMVSTYHGTPLLMVFGEEILVG